MFSRGFKNAYGADFLSHEGVTRKAQTVGEFVTDNRVSTAN